MGMGRNGKSLMGIPWEWELVTTTLYINLIYNVVNDLNIEQES